MYRQVREMLLSVDSALSYAVVVHIFIGQTGCWCEQGVSVASTAVSSVTVYYG